MKFTLVLSIAVAVTIPTPNAASSNIDEEFDIEFQGFPGDQIASEEDQPISLQGSGSNNFAVRISLETAMQLGFDIDDFPLASGSDPNQTCTFQTIPNRPSEWIETQFGMRHRCAGLAQESPHYDSDSSEDSFIDLESGIRRPLLSREQQTEQMNRARRTFSQVMAFCNQRLNNGTQLETVVDPDEEAFRIYQCGERLEKCANFLDSCSQITYTLAITSMGAYFMFGNKFNI